MKINLEKDKLLVVLLLTDLAFILLHVLYVYTGLLNDSLYSSSLDRGYAEFFQYSKEFWVAVLLLLMGIKQRRRLYTVFSFLFLYFLIDDSFEFHERFCAMLADLLHLQPVFGLRAVDFGEMLVSAVFGLMFLISIGIFYLLADQFSRQVAIYLIGMIVILVGFGVLLDMVEILFTQTALGRILVIIEEGGEMLVMSVITCFVFRLNFNNDEFPFSWLPLKWLARST